MAQYVEGALIPGPHFLPPPLPGPLPPDLWPFFPFPFPPPFPFFPFPFFDLPFPFGESFPPPELPAPLLFFLCCSSFFSSLKWTLGESPLLSRRAASFANLALCFCPFGRLTKGVLERDFDGVLFSDVWDSRSPPSSSSSTSV